MHALLSLISVFTLAAVVFIIYGAEVFGLMLLIVYVGAVAILFLFVTMLLRVAGRAVLPVEAIKRFANLGSLCGLAIVYISHSDIIQYAQTLKELIYSFVSRFVQFVNYVVNDVMAFAALYSSMAELFSIITIVLLVAMLGAIVLATATVDEAL